MISLSLNNGRENENLGVVFNSVSGFSRISSDFSWQTSCSLLGENFENMAYNFRLLLNDDKCVVPLIDTVDMVIVIGDEAIDYDFLPPNVFTPNDTDAINESYFIPNLPGDNCERQFEEVAIYNRFGTQVYNSKDRDFRWTGENHPSGVYFYYISYTDFSIKGTVSIVR